VFAVTPGDGRAAIAAGDQCNATAAWTLLHTFLPQRICPGRRRRTLRCFRRAQCQQTARATQIPKNGVEIVKAKLGNTAGCIAPVSPFNG
jgi:hypothetical protein